MGTFEAYGADDLAGWKDDFGETVVAGATTTVGVRDESPEVFEAAAGLGLQGVTTSILIETGSLPGLAVDLALTFAGVPYVVRGYGPADAANTLTRIFVADG